MTTVGSLLPRIFQWVFLVLAIVFAMAALAIGVVILIDPHLPQGLDLGPAQINWMGQPGTVALRASGNDADFTAALFNGTITLAIAKAGGLVEILTHYGLPFILLNLVFLAVLFEFLSLLFRNVGRGESFSRDTVKLVQAVGGLLIGFSFISSFVQGLFVFRLYRYAVQHALITVSGAPLHLPLPQYEMLPSDGNFPFGSPLFFSGLLVLALSEVFRQGLVLKNEHELTI